MPLPGSAAHGGQPADRIVDRDRATDQRVQLTVSSETAAPESTEPAPAPSASRGATGSTNSGAAHAVLLPQLPASVGGLWRIWHRRALGRAADCGASSGSVQSVARTMPDFQLQHPRDISSMTEANPGYPHGDLLANYTLRAKESRFRPIVGAVAVRLSERVLPLVFSAVAQPLSRCWCHCSGRR